MTHHEECGDTGCYISLSEQGLRDLLSSCDPRASEADVAAFPATHLSISAPAFLRHRVALSAGGSGDSLNAEEELHGFLRQIVAEAYRLRGIADSGIPYALANQRKARDHAARVLAILAGRYAEKLSLDGIAREVGCSAFHLSHVFTAVAGQSIHQMVVGFRLRAALDLILSGERSLSRIGRSVGFSSHSHFTNAFHRAFGSAPSTLQSAASSARRRGASATTASQRRNIALAARSYLKSIPHI